ncbi:proline--tRNA ligase [Candidatus Solincola tengchongensis]|uniref:proline--tRNA ligase n=1 Tax=Candidatus Solincola tengchongensis TaxID=2900693 RepID=UPI00258016E8|nr:proline--tRNA ligase [Candidatus Solincola tengchongensis]
MRQSRTFIPTLRESPADAEIASHRLLVRAGYLRKVASGIYEFLPLGTRVVQRISRIIREEMNAAGAQEVILPIMQPRELWEESGRWAKYGPEMMRLKDRAGRDFGLGPTHEEVITDLVRSNVSSYRDLPLNLYQIGTKFRDEVRPRFGLLRAREFLMKDAYSFDRDEEGMRLSYQAMYEAYGRIFTRCGCTWRAVEAATGLIGGDVSHEFMVPAAVGEDHIALCDACSYSANLELAGYRRVEPPSGERKPMERVSTPGQRTIEEVSAYLGLEPRRMIKCLMYLVEGKPVAVLVPGDREANEVKLARVLGTDEFRLFNEADWRDHPEYLQGYVGPVGLDTAEVIADESLRGAGGLACGANQEDHHLVNVEEGRDFRPHRFADVTSARTGDPCPRCGEPMRVEAGIEVGQVFQLGLKYSEAMRCYYQDEDGETRPMYMGCYGIGVTRLMAAVVEQHHDERGIIWPLSVAPAFLHVLALDYQREERRRAAEDLYVECLRRGWEVLLDDREESAGVKFADADLLGIPFRAVIGRGYEEEGTLELQERATGQKVRLAPEDLFRRLQEARESFRDLAERGDL